jgi:GNAT superfamily N-acetyltransferase
MLHPDHDEIAREVRGWYRTSYPEMGYVVDEGRFGWYGRNVSAPAVGRLTIRDAVSDTDALLRDVRDHFGSAAVTIYVEDKVLDAKVGGVLAAAGCRAEHGDIFLAHVGPVPNAPAPAGLDVSPCEADSIEEYAITKLRGFADSENQPPQREVADEVALRTAELSGTACFAIARLHGQPAAIAGWYSGVDQLIFQLATRVPFRRRGIATALLLHVLKDAARAGARSVIINAAEDGQPVQLYRRLGFTDEVYWRRPYRVPQSV